LKEESRKELQILVKENEELRDEIYRKNEEIEHLKETVIVNLKKDINEIQKESIKSFKENERREREMERLVEDNKSMEGMIEKINREKKQYYSKYDELKEMKESIKKEIMEKDKIIKLYVEN
jgi:chromosome segregation ATPase